jgi:hypothetical protein
MFGHEILQVLPKYFPTDRKNKQVQRFAKIVEKKKQNLL